MNPKAVSLIEAYYDAFNREDMTRFLDLLTEDVIHDLNQGTREVGKAAFADFMAIMLEHYQERITDLVLMVSEDGQRVAAESKVTGTYLKSQKGLPLANGQGYQLPVGAFFEIRDGKIARVTSYYNLQDWIAQVSTANE
jgi:steroid delta-isomerase-like uncharacterized protein